VTYRPNLVAPAPTHRSAFRPDGTNSRGRPREARDADRARALHESLVLLLPEALSSVGQGFDHPKAQLTALGRSVDRGRSTWWA